MSFEIDWDQITNDARLNDSMKSTLNDYFQGIKLPSYLSDLRIIDFNLGGIPPIVTLQEISKPLPCIDPDPQENDIQCVIEVQYEGDMAIRLSASLVLNYPQDKFMTLPVTINISMLRLHCLCISAYLSTRKQFIFSVLCDVGDVTHGEDAVSLEGRLGSPLERLAVVRNLKIETEIGDEGVNGDRNTLKSVDKLEQFLLEKFKDFIRKEIGWPSWITMDFNDDDDSELEEEQLSTDSNHKTTCSIVSND